MAVDEPEIYPLPSRAWLDIDLRALRENAARVKTRSGLALIPMIKADGYGVGAIPVAHALESLDPYAYGVATVDEGELLRASGIERRIIIFTPILQDDFDARAPRAA